MSEQVQDGAPEAPQTPAPAVDEIKNLKAEFNRKLENQNAQMQQLLASLKQPPTSTTESKKVSVFEDEEGYARRIKEEAKREIQEQLAVQAQTQSKYQTIVNQIVQDFPEANDTSSELYKLAQQHYSSLGDDEKASPLALKASVASAAAELGLKPKSKRSTSTASDNVVMSSSSGSSSRKRDDLDSATSDFARIMGLNMDDPKVRDRIKNRKVNIRR